jgi:hypothetical protein
MVETCRPSRADFSGTRVVGPERKEYTKPKLQKHELSETPRLWPLIHASRALLDEMPDLFGAVMHLARIAAKLQSDEAGIEDGGRPVGADFSTDILSSVKGRLASINLCAVAALRAIADGDNSRAMVVVCAILAEMGHPWENSTEVVLDTTDAKC